MEYRGEHFEKTTGIKLSDEIRACFAAQVAKAELKASSPADVKPGYNEILVKTVDFGHQKMIMEKDVPVVMRDGVTLYVNVFRPIKPGKYPVVLSACVYGKDSNNEVFLDMIMNHAGVYKHSNFTAFESPDPGYWVPNDYVVVKAAVRGTSNSEGVLDPFSQTEALDYAEIIEWCGTQAWSCGNVGLNGVSYLAMLQWYVAALNPPHLKAIIPWEGGVDVYREWAFHGGMPDTFFARLWDATISGFHKKEMECISTKREEHPFDDEYWQAKRAKVEQIQVPMYVGASWGTQGLHTRGSLEGYKQSSSKNKWIEIHGRKEWEYYYSRECLERQKAFFDCFLKGIENDWMDTPRVRLEVRNKFFDGEFRYENEYPIARTTATPLYLDCQNRSLSVSPVKNEGAAIYEADQATADGVRFRICFDKDTELTGSMKLKLWVSAVGADDMDLFIGIKKYDRRGNEVQLPDWDAIEHGQVATGWLRVSHRELDEKLSTPLQPWHKHQRALKLKEGEIVPVEVEIQPSGTLFKKGESLELVIQNTDIVQYTPPQYGCRHNDTVNRGKHVVHAGGVYDSHLLVPIIPEMA